MKVNFIVEDMGTFKYLGCATAAKNLYNGLSNTVDISWNDKSLDYDIAHFHTFGPASLLYAKRFKGKKIITAHSTPKLNIGNIAVPSVVNWLYRPIYNSFDHIIAVSNKCKKELNELKINKEVSTIYNGINRKQFSPNQTKRKKFRTHYKIKDDELIILTVAQRTPRKGIYDFLEVARRLHPFRFIWIGGFPYNIFSKDYARIKRAIETRSKNVLFPGFIQDIIEAYSAADVFFMPSYAEGHSIVMLEALAMKLPLIARDLEEFREAFADNLIYFNDSKEIDEHLFDINMLEQYGKKTSIISEFDIEKIAQQHINLYKKIIEN